MNKLLAVSTLALMIGFAGAAHAQYQGAMAPRGGFTGRDCPFRPLPKPTR